MCGITGFVDFNKRLNKQHLINACNALQHRGPDDEDARVLNSTNSQIGLGHRRLSILDTTERGHQPMFNHDRSIAIVLNGEIYNFKEIRKSLEQKGHCFISSSDTEVVIKAYEEYGIECLHEFNGMFAFVLYDQKAGKVFLVRDRAGVKPLYYAYRDDSLLFGSELKALLEYPSFKKDIDQTAVSLFFSYGYIRAPYTIYKNALKLLPGHYAELDLSTKELELHQYWNVLDHYNKRTKIIHEKMAVPYLEDLFLSAFQYRMVSDVPVGIFLSGGYDSSLIAAILQKNSTGKLKTFTIGFHEEEFNEAPFARKIADHIGTDHHEYYCTPADVKEIIGSIPFHFDEPFGDASAIPTMLLSRFARKSVTVALSGDAGDEIFAGYNRYDQLTKLKKLKEQTPAFLRRSAIAVLEKFPGTNARFKKIAEVFATTGDADMSDAISKHFTRKELVTLLRDAGAVNEKLINGNVLPLNNDFINTLLAADYKTYLPDDILVKVDRATMSAGLEGREPLLDHRIIEWVAQLPSGFKYNNGVKKYLLRKLAHHYVPSEMLNREKMGFGIPLNKWMKNELKQILTQYVNKEAIEKHGIIDGKYAEQVRDAYLAGKSGFQNQLWLLLMFQMWWEKWME